jgi:hypothetical protein
MKFQLLALAPFLVSSVPESPINKVVLFIKQLKSEVEADGAREATAYGQHASWCNTTIITAQKDIATATTVIEDATAKINSFAGGGAAAGADIAYLKKSLSENDASQKDAVTIREQEKKAFEAAEGDWQTGIKAMQDMYASLAPKPTSNGTKASFLFARSEVSQELEHRNFDVSTILNMPALTTRMSTDQLQFLQEIAEGSTSLIQASTNAAPNSAISGVLGVINQTLQDYQGDYAAAKAEEEQKVADHQKMMDTLSQEFVQLTKSLNEQTSRQGDNGKQLADAKALKAETELSVKANQKLLTETQDGCAKKADDFAARSKLRKQELQGISEALVVLTSENANKTFAAQAVAGKSFAQVSFLQMSQGDIRHKAYLSVKALATRYQSLSLAKLAVQVKNSGHFDAVIRSIDKQIVALRAEEQKDVEHRDRCQDQIAKSLSLIQDLNNSIATASTKLAKLAAEGKDVQNELALVKAEINKSTIEIQQRTLNRQKERDANLVALKHDKEALEILRQATVTITDFYKKNKSPKVKISMIEAQPKSNAPDAGFADANYKGSQDGANGVISLMKMIEEDMIRDMQAAQDSDQKADEQYQKDYAALKDKLDSQKAIQASSEKALGELTEKVADRNSFLTGTNKDKASEENNQAVLQRDCAWVRSNFDSRRTKRQAEIDGLQEAKSLLAEGNAR